MARAETMTFTVAASADDGLVGKGGATYPPTSMEVIWTSESFTGPVREEDSNYNVFVGLIRWDTSSLPDNATIQSAALRCYLVAVDRDDSFSLTADWYDNWPIDIADWSFTPQRSALSDTPLSNFTVDTTASIPLSNTRGVSTTSYTALRLHFSGQQPSLLSRNKFLCASFDEGVHTAPQLIVTYTIDSGGTYIPPNPPPPPQQPSPATTSATSTPPTPATPVPPATPPAPPRDLALERAAIGVFGRLFRRLPASSADWRAIHYLAYGGATPARDLAKERAALGRFRSLFGRLPNSGEDWRALHLIAYGL